MKEKIIWSDAEVNIVVEELAKLRIERPEDNFLGLVREAQYALPEPRRREIKQASAIPDIVQKLKLRLTTKEPKPKPEEILAQLRTDTLLAYALNRLVQKVETSQKTVEERVRHLEGLAYRILSQKPKDEAPQVQEIKARKPKICILGLLPDQIGHIRIALEDRFDFKFVDKNNAAFDVSNADRVVLMCDFINHGIQERVFSQIERSKVALHFGGITKLVELLRSF